MGAQNRGPHSSDPSRSNAASLADLEDQKEEQKLHSFGVRVRAAVASLHYNAQIKVSLFKDDRARRQIPSTEHGSRGNVGLKSREEQIGD